MGVLVGVGGNQTTVRVGVCDGAGVSVGVGGISVGGEQAVSMKRANKQIAIVQVCELKRLLIRQLAVLLIRFFVFLPLCSVLRFSSFTQSPRFGSAPGRQMPS